MPPIRRPKWAASTTTASQANQQRQAAAPRHGLRSRATRSKASGPVSVLGHTTSSLCRVNACTNSGPIVAAG
jgi:hypothetical protein